MAARVRSTGFERGEQNRTVQLVAPVLSLQQREFRMVAMAQFPSTGCLDLTIRLDENTTDFRRILAVRSWFGYGLAHHLDGLFHEFARIDFLHRPPPNLAIILSNSPATFALKSASIW